MKTLAQFKAENAIEKIELLQGKGRKFCTVRDKSLIVAEKCDLSKPLYVTEMTKPVDANEPEGERTVVPNTFIILNASSVKAVEVL